MYSNILLPECQVKILPRILKFPLQIIMETYILECMKSGILGGKYVQIC
jgi:hypothetical protein